MVVLPQLGAYSRGMQGQHSTHAKCSWGPLLREETKALVPPYRSLLPGSRANCQLPAHSNTPSGEGSGLEVEEHFRIVSRPQVILQKSCGVNLFLIRINIKYLRSSTHPGLTWQRKTKQVIPQQGHFLQINIKVCAALHPPGRSSWIFSTLICKGTEQRGFTPLPVFKYVGVCLLGEFQAVLSAVELPPDPAAKVSPAGSSDWSSLCFR